MTATLFWYFSFFFLLSFSFSFFPLVSLPIWGLIRSCLGTLKKITFLSVTGENVFFLGNGKGINQGEGRRIYSHTGLVCQIQWWWGRVTSHPWDRPSPFRLGSAWLTAAPKASTNTQQTMPEKHLLPPTLSFPKEMIKKLKKHFHMEESYPNRSPQRYFKHNKTGRAKKSSEVHRAHTIFYIGKNKKPPCLYTVQNFTQLRTPFGS